MVENRPPENSVRITISLDPDSGELRLASDGHIPDTLEQEYADALIDISLGLNMIVESGLEYLAATGSVLRMLEAAQAEDEIEFEADDELLDAIAKRKVIPFDKKKLN